MGMANVLRIAVFSSLALIGVTLGLGAQEPADNEKPGISESGFWREQREVAGRLQWIQVHAWHDAETDSEFTIYYAEDGSVLPGPLQVQFGKSKPKAGTGTASTLGEAAMDGLAPPTSRRRVARPAALARKSAAQTRAATSRHSDLGVLSPEEAKRLADGVAREASRPGGKRVVVGLTRTLPAAFIFLGTDRNVTWVPAGDGGWVAHTLVNSTDAEAIRIHWQGQNLPEGIVLSVLNADGTAAGSALGRDDLVGTGEEWAPSIQADSAVLEVYLPPGADPADPVAQLSVNEVVHKVKSLAPAPPKNSTVAGNESYCHNNLACASSTWRNVGNAVAYIEFLEGSIAYICTGSLLNDADPGTQAPYFMTANHCIGSQSVANTIEFDWFFQATSCSGTATLNSPQVVTTTGGGTLLATRVYPNDEFSLLRLSVQPPSGVYYAGWYNDTFSNGEDVTGIHHPAGAYKRISTGDKTNHTNDFWQITWKVNGGVTEGGSSGSPLYRTSSQQFIGQLYGGTSSCSSPQSPDIYGRFITTYPYVSGYLDNCYISTQPQSATITTGTTKTLTVAVGNGGSLSYRWFTGTPGSGSAITGATSSSYTTPALTNTTSYYVEVTKSGLTPTILVRSTAAVVTVVDAAPVFTLQPVSNTEKAAGQTTQFTTTVTGTNLSYQWFQGTTPGTGGTLIGGATSANYTTPALNATTSYWLRVSNSGGTIYSNLATVTIVQPPVFTQQPAASTEKLVGETAQFTTAATGASLSYQWFEGSSPGTGGTSIGGATTANYTTSALNSSTGYWLRVSNIAGTVYSNLASVTVFANAYYQWASHSGIPDAPPGVDSDDDGLSNDLEYILNFNPLVNSQGQLPVPQFASGTGLPMITFPIMSGLPAGTSITVRSSLDLQSWVAANVVINGTTVTATAGSASDPQRYFEIQGTLPP